MLVPGVGVSVITGVTGAEVSVKLAEVLVAKFELPA